MKVDNIISSTLDSYIVRLIETTLLNMVERCLLIH